MKNNKCIYFLIGVLFIAVLFFSLTMLRAEENQALDKLLLAEGNQVSHEIRGEMGDTSIQLQGEVRVEGPGTFTFNPREVETLRPDIFQEGHFSLFDVLVYLKEEGHFEMEYELDEELNTYVIHSLDGESDWWYSAYYDRGWPENSVFRMDHYPYKDGMHLEFVQVSADYLNSVYETYRGEVERKQNNDGRVVVPEVIIRGRNTTQLFEDVEINAHDLRDDIFHPGVITAIDVIKSLGEAGKISYDLQWYESLGRAEIVKSYWVNRINDDESYGRCGFVYEAGSPAFRRFRGNHNHIPSDTRVINSPKYVEYFWICI